MDWTLIFGSVKDIFHINNKMVNILLFYRVNV